MKTVHGNVKVGDSLVLIQGPIILQAIAAEDKYIGIGNAMFSVTVARSVNFVVGVSRITINLNHWDVYEDTDPQLTSRIIGTIVGDVD
jgi:hypothetical protein